MKAGFVDNLISMMYRNTKQSKDADKMNNSIRQRFISGFSTLLGCLMLPLASLAQITIAPTSLYMDDRERFVTMLVLNGSDQAQEVSIDFEFGYLGADEEGNTRMVYNDEEAEGQYSIADRIRAFPRTFTLQPDQRQTVRMTVRNTGDLSEGTYWTRVRTESNPLSPPIEQQAEGGVAARINFTVEQVTAAFLKKGDVSTGLQVDGLAVSVDENGRGTISADLEQTGNSPFIGQMNLRILDHQNEPVAEGRNTVAIYFDTKRNFNFDAADLSSGAYTAELTFETRRNDVSADDLVQGENVTETVEFRIP